MRRFEAERLPARLKVPEIVLPPRHRILEALKKYFPDLPAMPVARSKAKSHGALYAESDLQQIALRPIP